MVAAIVFSMMALTPTDQTVNVTKGTKLEVNNFAGDVNVKAWDRDAVRVEVEHSDRETVDIRNEDGVVHVRGRSTRGGPPRSLDYTISVPGWMAVSVAGTYADTTLDGVGGDVTVDTTRGDIKVRGGSGFISLKSVQGEITLEKAKGKIEIRGVNESIHLADITGDLSAETTNGSIILDRIDSGNVDLYTVNGNISYDGPIKDKGVYRLTTHNGMIAMPIAEKVNATITARTYNGSIRSSFPLPASDNASSERRNRRLALTLGNGSAHVELESFGGTIALRRPGEARPEIERRRRERDDDGDKAKDKAKEKAKDIGKAIGSIDIDVDQIGAEVSRALADAQPEIDAAIAQATAALAGIMPLPNPMPRPRPR
ncbi:MAG TPA: DUF4097 family beta strand repeat-containing protein [Vicinamibacterales bacterium]|nr:DUF4097 family beta strand repeat-containing protein [Vicinamibacterales bacterium]